MVGIITEAKARKLASNYKLTPATLIKELKPEWIPARWLQYVAVRVATAIHKGNGRLIISAPPRHGKSELITIATSLWVQEIYHKANVILTSYGGDLAADFGRQVRNIINENPDLLDVRISQDRSQAKAWRNQWGGGMNSVGLGGTITGRGADVLLIDDFIKEIKEALSVTTRQYIWDWFVTTAFTRIEPGGTCIIIATRWHHDDLIGRILSSEDMGEWEYIHMPAFAEENDILGREIGEPLFPERYDTPVLIERKKILGTFFFNALFQQNPENPESKLTDASWLRILPRSECPAITDFNPLRVWDLAATEDGGDYTTGGKYYYDSIEDIFYIDGMIRVQKSPGSIENLVEDTAKLDGVGTEIVIEQEPGSSGKILSHHFKNTILPDFTTHALPARDGKIARTQPFLAAVEAGRVILIEGPWNEAFIKEFGTFPGGEHDDQVDNAGMGYAVLTGKTNISPTWGRKRVSTGHRVTTHLETPSTILTGRGVKTNISRGPTWGRKKAG